MENKKYIEVGQRYATRNVGDAYAPFVILVEKVERNPDLDDDGIAYFTIPVRLHNKLHHSCRFWWLREYCREIKA